MPQNIFIKQTFKKYNILSVLLIFILLMLLPYQVMAKSQPEPTEPDLSKVIPLSVALSARLVYFQNNLSNLMVIKPIDERISIINNDIDVIAMQLQSLKDSQKGNYISYFTLKQSLSSEMDLLNEINNLIITSVKLLDDWEEEWQADKQNWQLWQDSLVTERTPNQLRLALEEAFIIIDTAQALVLQHLNPLLEVQSKAARVTSKISILK